METPVITSNNKRRQGERELDVAAELLVGVRTATAGETAVPLGEANCWSDGKGFSGRLCDPAGGVSGTVLLLLRSLPG